MPSFEYAAASLAGEKAALQVHCPACTSSKEYPPPPLPRPVQLARCVCIFIFVSFLFVFLSEFVQGVFLTGTPAKSTERLG